MFCEQTNKSRQCGKSFYVGNITQIARQDRSEMRPSPIVSAPLGTKKNGGTDHLHEVSKVVHDARRHESQGRQSDHIAFRAH